MDKGSKTTAANTSGTFQNSGTFEPSGAASTVQSGGAVYSGSTDSSASTYSSGSVPSSGYGTPGISETVTVGGPYSTSPAGGAVHEISTTGAARYGFIDENTEVFEEAYYEEAAGGIRIPILGDIPVIGRAFRDFEARSEPAKPKPARIPSEFAAPDELWILVRPEDQPKFIDTDELPRAGLIAELPEDLATPDIDPDGDGLVELPLQHTKVRADIAGVLNTVRVLQQYANPFDEKIEVTYQFPLPTDAAVTDFIMIVGDRTIRGIIREKEEAQEIYRTARDSGYAASLMTQARPNIFEQKVANIEPGNQIDLDITYFNTLQLVDGYYEFAFPTTIGPRYNPPGTTDGIGAAPHGKTTGQPTTITYLPPGQRAGNDIELTINLNAGLPIRDLTSPSHDIQQKVIDDTHHEIRLAPADTIPNRDFVFRYRLASDELQTAFLRNGDHFVALLEPPDDLRHLEKQARELIFVVDCSGSMSGQPMKTSKKAMRKALNDLDADDTFAILRFSDETSAFSETPLPATRRNIRKGLKYIESLNGSGGTHMLAGIEAAMNYPRERARQRIITFMTDGFIGNEDTIFSALEDGLGDARVFSFGIGNSVNRHLIEGMARHGGGAAAFILIDEDPEWVVDSFYTRIAHPALMSPEIDWNGFDVTDVYPSRFPDLLPGRPLLITGRCKGPLPPAVTLKGTVGGKTIRQPIAINPANAQVDHPGIESLWARQRLAAMDHHEITHPDSLIKPLMTDFSIEHSVLSKYTAFVAVDSETQTNPREVARKVQQPNTLPKGVKYETTVGMP